MALAVSRIADILFLKVSGRHMVGLYLEILEWRNSLDASLHAEWYAPSFQRYRLRV